MSEKNSIKWYHRPAGIVILLVIFFPLGLYYMWTRTEWSRNVKWAVTGLYIFIALKEIIFPTSLEVSNGVSNTPAPIVNHSDNEIAKPEVTVEPINSEITVENSSEVEVTNLSKDIVVSSQIVKRVNGKYRYFFDIRNNSDEMFEGEVTIELKKSNGNVLGKNTFNTTKPIEPSLGDSVYFDINSGPVGVFNEEFGVSKFSYDIKVSDNLVNRGESEISTEFEIAD